MTITITRDMGAEQIRQLLDSLPKRKIREWNVMDHVGVIKRKTDALVWQKKFRDEWE